MTNWKSAILELKDWIEFQQNYNSNFMIADIKSRIFDMVFNLCLEDLGDSSDIADKELYEERIKEGEILYISKYNRNAVCSVEERPSSPLS